MIRLYWNYAVINDNDGDDNNDNYNDDEDVDEDNNNHNKNSFSNTTNKRILLLNCGKKDTWNKGSCLAFGPKTLKDFSFHQRCMNERLTILTQIHARASAHAWVCMCAYI